MFHKIGEQGNSLYRFTKPHLVRQNSVQVVVVERDHPIEPEHLVGLKLATNEHLGLLVDFLLDRVGEPVVDLGRIPHILHDQVCVSLLNRGALTRLFLNLVAASVHVLQHLFLFAVLHAELSLFDQGLVLGLLEDDLGSQTHNEAVSLLENLHEARVLLGADQFKVRVHVVVLQGVNTGLLLLVLLRVNNPDPAFQFN
jgi:hypothetical protein